MALELRRGKSKWWYGQIQVNDRKITKNLGVEICGTIPPRLSMVGDIIFERSRAKAQAALERFQIDTKKRCKSEELIQTIHEIRTGERVLKEKPARESGLKIVRPVVVQVAEPALVI